MKGIRKFNVINPMHERYDPYDIMEYLKNKWDYWKKECKKKRNQGSDYFFLPTTDKEIRNWVERELRFQFWGRCEWEMILSSWPSYTNEKGEAILKEGKKIDVYEQCELNMDIIVQIFKEDVMKI